MTTPQRGVVRQMRGLATGASLLAIAMAATALLGWTLHLVTLERVMSGLATMKANTAVSLLLCGGGLLSASRSRGGRGTTLSFMLASAGALLAAFALVETATGVNLHIDQAVFADRATAAMDHPGRPSPATAVCLLCVGVAIACGCRRPPLPALLAGIALTISTLAMLGYAFGFEALYQIHAYASMALHTAIAIAALSAGTLLARPRCNLPALLVSRSQGGALTRRLLPVTVIVPVSAGWLCLIGLHRAWYAAEFGFALFALSSIATFAAGVWINATLLDSADARRRVVERDRDESLVRERAARQAAESALTARDELLSVVSHELRTPLQPVELVTEALASRDDLPADVHGDIRLIREQLRIEVLLIDDLLDVVRLREAKLVALKQRVDFDATVRQMIESYRRQFEALPVEISLETAPGERFITGDPARVRQIVNNLLGNALKFTPPRGRVRLRTDSADGRVRLCVVDTGIGISAAAMPRLFEAFAQADASTTRRFGGLGLGLMISRRLAEMHGGTLTASSEGVNRGATFCLELPLAPTEPSAPSAPGRSAIKAASRPAADRRLLLVEDNAQTLSLLKRLLTSKGFKVVPATSGFEALSAVEQAADPFDVLVSDIGMPDMNGWDLMHRLGTRAPARSIAVSGFVADSDRQRSLAAGFAEHLAKPIDLDKLLRAIEMPLIAG